MELATQIRHNDSADVIVVGGGPAGLTAAIALAKAGLKTSIVARAAPADHRTTALFAGSVTALETLGIWEHCKVHAAPLRRLRIIDDTAWLLRAPEACFEAEEIGLSAFGYNIENRHLLAGMQAQVLAVPGLRAHDTEAVSVTIDAERVAVGCDDGSVLAAPLVIGADGHRSMCRKAAGIEVSGWRYPQVALTFNIQHSRPHEDISTEFHTESGPFTVVPLPGSRSSVVCVADPGEGERLRALDDAGLGQEAELRSHSILGKITVEPGRGFFPLAADSARLFACNRIMLVGEAAHRIPPIGAQGLNLGLRDAATAAELVARAKAGQQDIGGTALLREYERLRRIDLTSRSFAVDLLNRTLLSGLLPLQGARGFGVYLMNRLGPLRRAIMREGIMPQASQPRLMRGEPITALRT